MTHNYAIMKIGRYYSALNMDTQQIDYGGESNAGGVKGGNRKAVVQKAIDMIEKPAIIYLWYISWYELKNEGIIKPTNVGIIQYSKEIGEIEHNTDLRHDHKKTDISDFSHTHLESEITDLIHDAQKIKGKTIDDSAIGDGKTLKYDQPSGKIIYAEISGMTIHGNEYHDPDFSIVGHEHYRSEIMDFFSYPFWANIPDKPSTYPPSSHTHVEADITDLIHDAQKIKGKVIDDSAIGDGKVLAYKTTSGKIEYMSMAGGGDMLKSSYDPNDDGVVKDSDKLEGSTKLQVQDHVPQTHGHSESDVTNLVSDLASKETPSGAQAKVDTHKDLTTGVHGVGAGTVAKVADITVDSNLSAAAQDTITKKHSHSNQTLLDSYTQTEANLADVVTKKHTHANQTLLDSYTQTEANLADAVTKKHNEAHTLTSHTTRAHSELTNIGESDHHTKFTITEHDTTSRHTLGTVVPHDTLASLSEKDHANLTNVTANQHHAQVHGSADHSGTIGTPTQVGLENVTNDAQLKRSDGDINSFTQKATPIANDILLIEDSVVSFAKKKITVGSLPTGGGGGVDENFRKIGTTQYESWYSPIATTTALTTGALTANRLYAFPFVVPATKTLDRIAINVTTAGTGNARLGIYTNSSALGLYPDQKVLDAGEVSIASTGVKSITISQQLTAGLYWLVLVSNGAPTVRSHAILGILPYLGYTSSLGAEVAAVGLYVSFTYAALPTTFPTTTTTKITAVPIPAIFVRLSA